MKKPEKQAEGPENCGKETFARSSSCIEYGSQSCEISPSHTLSSMEKQLQGLERWINGLECLLLGLEFCSLYPHQGFTQAWDSSSRDPGTFL